MDLRKVGFEIAINRLHLGVMLLKLGKIRTQLIEQSGLAHPGKRAVFDHDFAVDDDCRDRRSVLALDNMIAQIV
jgi:hypothetical protein